MVLSFEQLIRRGHQLVAFATEIRKRRGDLRQAAAARTIEAHHPNCGAVAMAVELRSGSIAGDPIRNARRIAGATAKTAAVSQIRKRSGYCPHAIEKARAARAASRALCRESRRLIERVHRDRSGLTRDGLLLTPSMLLELAEELDQQGLKDLSWRCRGIAAGFDVPPGRA